MPKNKKVQRRCLPGASRGIPGAGREPIFPINPKDQLALIYWQLMKNYQNAQSESKKDESDLEWEEYKRSLKEKS